MRTEKVENTKYEEVFIDIILLETRDIIITSGDDNDLPFVPRP